MGELSTAFKVFGNIDLRAVFKEENFVAGNIRDSLEVSQWPEKWIAFIAMVYSDGGSAGVLITGEKNIIQQQYWMREKIELTTAAEILKIGTKNYLNVSKPWWKMVGATLYKISG